MIDLHTHSYFSDGTSSPKQLIEMAETLSMKAIAITDHDTTSGLKEGAAAAKNKNVIFIPGIEISVDHNPGELHILGLGLKNWEKATFLQGINTKRKTRNMKIVELMNYHNIKIKYNDLQKLTKGTIGRPHFASWLVSNGYVKNIKEAFSDYLVQGKPFYIKRETVSLEDTINFIHSSGAYAIIAHPLNIPVNFSTLLKKIDTWIDMGIDGVEAVHSGAKRNLTNRLLDYSLDKGCMITGGSDFHGKNKSHIKLGKTRKAGKISDEYLPGELIG
jgi:3',5'-nucleoside bisphosphate phosphatase